jgi:hypothetical protein
MKTRLLTFALFLCVTFSYAQSNKEDVEIIQNIFGKEKKELVQSYMTIPEDKKTEFWTLYDKYEIERKNLGKERIALIESYANSYETLDDKKAVELMSQKMKWLDNYSKFQKKYYGSVSKLLGGRQASKFFQLEDYIENNIRVFIQESIPFIDELDKSKVNVDMKQ